MIRENLVVNIPEKTKISTYNNVKYVYYVKGKEYINRTRGYKEDRVSIGRVIDDKTMHPNENYFTYFSDLLSDDITPKYSDALHIGASSLLYKIADDIKLSDILYNVHGDIAGLILDISAYMIIEESNVMQHFPNYVWEHDVRYHKYIDDTKISGLKNLIQTKDIENFLIQWNKHQDKNGLYISYDSTNFTTTAEGIDLSEVGHSKDGTDLSQVNLSYAINHKDATPLFYELYPGSIIDNSQCRFMIDKAKEYGYTKVGFVLDRGYFSRENIKYLQENDCNYVLMMKINSKLIQEELLESQEYVKDKVVYYIAKHNVYGKTYEKELFNGKQYVHIYYDNERASEEKNIYLHNLERKKELLTKKIIEGAIVTDEFREYYKEFEFILDKKKVKDFKLRVMDVQEIVDSFGYFAIITSEKMTASEAIDVYRERDSIEKIFAMLKTGCGSEKERVHSGEQLEAKIYISFIASIIRSRLHQLLEPLYAEDRKKYTIPAVLGELERVMFIKNANDEYVRRYALTQKQKKILSVAHVTEKTINERLEYINSLK